MSITQLTKTNRQWSEQVKETTGWLVAAEAPFPKAIHLSTKALS
jgi:hypothetical protein